MAIDSRTTNKLSYFNNYRTYGYIPWFVIFYDSYGYATYPRYGTYKQIVSERGGNFIPGRYKVNPVTIKSAVCSQVAGSCQTLESATNRIYGADGNIDAWAQYNPTFDSLFSSWDTNMANYAHNKAHAKLQSVEADIALMLAELNETVQLLRNPIKALAGGLRDLLRKARNTKHEGQLTLDMLTGGWLTYRYALVPLISDINSLIDLYHKKLVQVQGFSRCAAGVSDRKVSITNSVYDSAGARVTVRFTRVETIKSTNHVYFQRILEADALYRARTLGFHPEQTLALVWESTLLSFVVDWAWAVGDWLRAIVPNTSIDYLGNCTTQKGVVELAVDCVSATPLSGYKIANFVPSNYRWKSETLIRKVELTTPVLPAFSPNVLNLKRTADLLSLLWQPVSQKLRKIKYAS